MQPNILLINCDDLGYGDLGCYGSALNRTPHIDRLAANGLRFTDFYMASPVCSASRAALMTGCWPNRSGFHQRPVLLPGSECGLSPDIPTVAKGLRDAGYATKLVGKWHCGDQPGFLPCDHGFDEYFGLPYSNDMGRQPDHPDSPPLPLMRNRGVLQAQPDQRGLTEQYARECLSFIDDHTDTPFFLYLAHMYVHVPLFVPKPFLDTSENGAYGGAVACIDWCTGLLVDRLRAHGLLENTLIVFTSDNGSRARGEGGSNAPCRGTKSTTWEGGQRVPCIAHWPGVIAPGRTSTGIARSLDLMPTFLALAGVQPDPAQPLDGIDLKPLLRGEEEVSAEEMIYYAADRLNALRVGDWKLHLDFAPTWGPVDEDAPEPPALYHLREDPGETRNRAADHPDLVDRLSRRMQEIRQDLGDARLGISGSGCRDFGRCPDPKPLTTYDPDHPYIVALYDLPDMPTLSG